MRSSTSELGCCPSRYRQLKEDGGGLGMSTECHRHPFQEYPCAGRQPEIEGGDDQKRHGGDPRSEKWMFSGGVGARSQSWQQTDHYGIPGCRPYVRACTKMTKWVSKLILICSWLSWGKLGLMKLPKLRRLAMLDVGIKPTTLESWVQHPNHYVTTAPP